MAKIALVNAPHYSGDSYMEGKIPPVGLIRLAMEARPFKNDIKIFDSNHILSQQDKFKGNSHKLIQKIFEYDPDYVGFSVVAQNYDPTVEVAKQLKENFPVKTFIGGPYVEARWKQILKNRRDLFNFIVIGSGDKIFRDNKLEFAIDNELKIINFTGWSPFDSAPPFIDYTVLDNPEAYFRSFVESIPAPNKIKSRNEQLKAPYVTVSGKGCEWYVKTGGCLFCSITDRHIYFREPESFWEDIKYAKEKFGSNYFYDVSDNFANNLDWLKQVAKTKSESDVFFQIYSRANRSSKEEVVKLFDEVGVATTYVGIESGSPKMLKNIRKGVTIEQILSSAELFKKYNIDMYFSVVLGMPGETEQTLEETYQLCKSIHDMGHDKFINSYILLPTPGSRIFNMLEDKHPEYKSLDIIPFKKVRKQYLKDYCPDVTLEMLKSYSEKIRGLSQIISLPFIQS